MHINRILITFQKAKILIFAEFLVILHYKYDNRDKKTSIKR